MSKQSFKIGNKEFSSRSAAAVELLKSGKSCSDVAKILNISTQTVYTQTTEGKAKVAARRIKYRATSLAKTGKYTAQMLCDRVQIEKSVLNKILVDAKISCPTVKDLAKTENQDNTEASSDSAAENTENCVTTSSVDNSIPEVVEKNVKKQADPDSSKKKGKKKGKK